MGFLKKIKRIWKYLGVGLISGAADDDPAGITTYAIAGTRLGFSSLWTAFFTYPLMTAIQEMAARIGIVTKTGLAGILKRYYSFLILIIVTLLMIAANTFNIGADISGMSAATNLIIPSVNKKIFAVIYSILIICLTIFLSFKKLIKYFKWLSLTLVFYVITAFFVSHNWFEIFKRIVSPQLSLNKETISIIIAIFGTTIAPYLFFWGATEEATEEKIHHHNHSKNKINDEKLKNELNLMEKEIAFGMFFSNFIMFFVMILSATLFFNKIENIKTIEELSRLLNPLLGRFAQIIFTIGIIGSGLLVIPILAGNSGYIIAEIFNWQAGLEKKFQQARKFYLVFVLSILIALIMNFFNFDPVKFLFYTAIFYGIISPVLILVIILIANNKKIMGAYRNNKITNILGIATFIVITIGVVLFFILGEVRT